ncbi:DUF4355 domain-containing protein [Paraclostridium dentum]|uniref:DUF4355 domain-containing protein n=1 Tax=Paraclostridium dentum TaxID=2662455 RepID=UPI0006899DE0|nr:DUF4355 domain-containing protein [Paraclostridium dentum]
MKGLKNTNEMLKMNIQLLASDEEQNIDDNNIDSDNTQDDDNEQIEDVKTEKTFTQEEVDKMIAKRIRREKEKAEAEKEEAEKLAKMSEKERQQALFDKQVKEFEETKKAFENEKLLNETTKQLAAKNLPVEFADMLKGTDAESTFENIKVFEDKFNKALESAINERLKRNVPKVLSNTSNSDVNPYSRKNWSLTKQMELERDNPELAQELKQQANN